MDAVRQWAFSVCAAAVVCSLLQLLLPSCSASRLARTAIAVFFLCALLQPIGLSSFAGELDRGTGQSLEQARQYAQALDDRLTRDVSVELTAKLEQSLADWGLHPEDYALQVQLDGGQAAAAVVLRSGSCRDPAALATELTRRYAIPVTVTTKEE